MGKNGKKWLGVGMKRKKWEGVGRNGEKQERVGRTGREGGARRAVRGGRAGRALKQSYV